MSYYVAITRLILSEHGMIRHKLYNYFILGYFNGTKAATVVLEFV
jgi:hypothetical protein